MLRSVKLVTLLILLAPPDATSRLMGAALSNSRAYDTVADLSDHVGHRMAGSQNAERGVEWALEWMRKNGFKNVHKEPVPVPHWMRGEASFEVVDPAQT